MNDDDFLFFRHEILKLYPDGLQVMLLVAVNSSNCRITEEGEINSVLII